MARFLLRRLGAAALLVLLVASLAFVVLRLAPGGPWSVIENTRVPRSQQERLSELYGLERPLAAQYLSWLSAVLLRGEWGISFAQGRPVSRILAEALPNTALLAAAALLVHYAVALALGVASARRPGSWIDHLVRVVSLGLYSVPLFLLGLLGIAVFSHFLGLLPASHMTSVDAASLGRPQRLADLLAHLALPALVLGTGSAGGTARFLRNSLLEVLSQDYTRTARAKGLSERRVVWIHVMRNAVAPLIQILGLSLPAFVSGSLVVEHVFSWPGMGQVTGNAFLGRDYPVLVASATLTGTLVVLGSLVADLLQAAADPRSRRR